MFDHWRKVAKPPIDGQVLTISSRRLIITELPQRYITGVAKQTGLKDSLSSRAAASKQKNNRTAEHCSGGGRIILVLLLVRDDACSMLHAANTW